MGPIVVREGTIKLFSQGKSVICGLSMSSLENIKLVPKFICFSSRSYIWIVSPRSKRCLIFVII